jgi:hypothetical protein
MTDEIFHPFNIRKQEIVYINCNQTCAILESDGKEKYRWVKSYTWKSIAQSLQHI